MARNNFDSWTENRIARRIEARVRAASFFSRCILYNKQVRILSTVKKAFIKTIAVVIASAIHFQKLYVKVISILLQRNSVFVIFPSTLPQIVGRNN